MTNGVTNLAATVAMPSRSGLLWRVGGSLMAAGVILLGFVLPAEYQIDPTGFGKRSGLARMAQASAKAAMTTSAHTYSSPTYTTHETDLTLRPGQEYEYKVRMKPEETLLFSWKSSVPLEFDFHGEADKDPGNAVSYKAGDGAELHGSLIAPFQGIHGWYWKNNSKENADIHLKMSGEFVLIEDF
ncbi:MAG: hypothetical protein EXQ47_08620 [Bryobacterales bacterium]|nr:hypothetical protein [Bryobacterales bacterium]